jgi:hypothetical protein
MFLKKRHAGAALLLGLVLSPLLCPERADAIPAFSRLHKTECSTCHTIYPELNEFGDAYLKNSYVWPGKKGVAQAAAKPSEDAAAGEGAAQKQGKNEWAWISGLPEQIPISFTGSVDLAYNNNASDKFDLSTRSLRLQAGSAFRETAGFYLTYNLYTQGEQRTQNAAIGSPANVSNNPPNETPNIDELFVFWRHALGTPINLKVGRFEPKLSLWKQSNRVIQTPSYASSSYLVGISPFRVDSTEDALEASALLGNRLLVAGGIVDRNGQNNKEGYGHASFKIGGTDFKGQEPEVDLENDSIWDFLTITLGTFGYSGRNQEFDTAGLPQNNFYRVGGEIDVLYKRLHLKGGGTFGKDSNPFFAEVGTSQDSQAYAVEGEYYLGAPVNLIPLFRFEYQDVAGARTRRYMPAIAYAPLQNTRISLRYIHEDGPDRVNRTAIASLAFSL